MLSPTTHHLRKQRFVTASAMYGRVIRFRRDASLHAACVHVRTGPPTGAGERHVFAYTHPTHRHKSGRSCTHKYPHTCILALSCTRPPPAPHTLTAHTHTHTHTSQTHIHTHCDKMYSRRKRRHVRTARPPPPPPLPQVPPPYTHTHTYTRARARMHTYSNELRKIDGKRTTLIDSLRFFRENTFGQQDASMAAVDSFELLLREISKLFSSVRDAFAIIGAYYVARKSLTLLSHTASAVYVHLYSGLAEEVDFRKKFGPWAGNSKTLPADDTPAYRFIFCVGNLLIFKCIFCMDMVVCLCVWVLEGWGRWRLSSCTIRCSLCVSV